MSGRDLGRRLLVGLASVALLAGCGVSEPATAADTFTIPASYGHPEILADVSWVSAHLDDPTVRIVDARMPMEATLYQTGHIPGAVYADVFEDVCCPTRIMPADVFATSMSKLGIGDGTTVVVYDTDGGLWGCPALVGAEALRP